MEQEGMIILPVIDSNYDEIIERSMDSPKQPHTRESLSRIQAQARTNNSVAMIMFIDPTFWKARLMEEVLAPTRDRRPKIEHRMCAWCKIVKPLNETCFEKKVTRKSNFRGVCIKCRKAAGNG